MARPFKFDTSTTPNSIKEMTDSEMNWIAHRILLAFASSDSGRGRVRVNTGTGTDIGTFVDTKRPGSIGDHPVGTTVNSTNYTFYQELTGTETEGHNSPVVFDTTLDGLQKASNARLNADINRRTFDIMSAGGLASYRLSANAPAGGTWTTIATITDTSLDADITTKLWRKTSETAPTVVRPLVFDSVLDGIQMISDAESSLLLEQYINYILSTGKGQYKAQSSAPTTGGTWVQMGDAFSDTRQQIGDVNYSGTYTGYSSANFIGYSQQSFTGTTSYASPAYSQAYGLNYGGYIRAYYTGYFTGYFTPTFTQDYTGTYTQNYTGTYDGTYTGTTILSTKEDVSTIKLWLRTA